MRASEEEMKQSITRASGGDQSHLVAESRAPSGEGCEIILWPIILNVVKEEVDFDYYVVSSFK